MKNNKINFSYYFQNFNMGSELFEKLLEKQFKKTQMDIIYDDFVRWEKFGLLTFGEGEKSSQRLYSYVDYVWIKIVEELRQFGFSYDSITNYKFILLERLSVDLYYDAFDKASKEDLIDINKEDLELIKEKRAIAYGNDEFLPFGYFEVLIVKAIFDDEKTSLLFFPDEPEIILPISAEIIKHVISNDDQSLEFNEYINKSHASISLNDIMEKFVSREELSNNKTNYNFNTILTKKEHALLKQIRKQHNNLKRISIRFSNNEMTMLEVQTTKKVSIESRLIEHINKGDYLNIEVETVDGNIVNYVKTEKIKL